MNILVTGANGQLGSELRLASAYLHGGSPDNDRFLFTDIADASPESVAMLRHLGGPGIDSSTCQLDITDPDAVRALVREEHVGAVINCAAFTDVDAAEQQPGMAELLNAKAPENLALAMQEAGGLLIHISTDYVFGGGTYDVPIREDEPPAPTGVYGRTKLLGEQAVRDSGCAHAIIRTAWLYSGFGRNFVRTILRLSVERPQLKVVCDQMGTPTYAGDLAGAVLAVLDDYVRYAESAPGALSWPRRGTYHYSGEGACSWFDFAREITSLAGRTDCEILPCRSCEYPSPVRRPKYSVLDKTRIRESFGLRIPNWTDSLRKCLENIL